MDQKLTLALRSYYPVSKPFTEAVLRSVSALTLPKNQHLHEAPKVADYMYFLVSGFAVSYTFIDGENHVETFRSADEFILYPSSFCHRKPSLEYVMLTRKSEVLCFSHEDALRLLHDYPEGSLVFANIVGSLYEESQARLRDIHLMGAEERYRQLLNRYRDIEQSVSQDTIASYLGITPQSLSRIKRRNRG